MQRWRGVSGIHGNHGDKVLGCSPSPLSKALVNQWHVTLAATCLTSPAVSGHFCSRHRGTQLARTGPEVLAKAHRVPSTLSWLHSKIWRQYLQKKTTRRLNAIHFYTAYLYVCTDIHKHMQSSIINLFLFSFKIQNSAVTSSRTLTHRHRHGHTQVQTKWGKNRDIVGKWNVNIILTHFKVTSGAQHWWFLLTV